MNKIYNIGLIITLLLVTSCNDWLDVRSKTEVEKEDLLSNYKGVRDALTGCYISLSSRSIYGEKLTITNIESMANLWAIDAKSELLDHLALSRHDYQYDASREIFKSFYTKLYNVAAQANLIIEALEANENIIDNKDVRDILLGEAYAIRGFCHLDILRLFGQMPKGGETKVDLPYANIKADVNEFPDKYNFEKYVGFLKEDFQYAEALLKDKDPVFKYTFSQLNDAEYIKELNDSYLEYRQFRFNYWAVRGLQARLALYIGEDSEAYEIAKSIITAVGPDSKPVMTLSGRVDLNNKRYACPGECLLAISKYDLVDYSKALLSTPESKVAVEDMYFLTPTMLGELFAGKQISTDNRYKLLWNSESTDIGNTPKPTIQKYYYTDAAANKMTLHQIIPLLRLSEIYLIAIETAPDLTESNSLYKTYISSHNVTLQGDAFASKEELKNAILSDYRIEFFAEGQMFYTYKRTNTSKILWYGGVMTEADYLIPVPAGE